MVFSENIAFNKQEIQFNSNTGRQRKNYISDGLSGEMPRTELAPASLSTNCRDALNLNRWVK